MYDRRAETEAEGEGSALHAQAAALHVRRTMREGLAALHASLFRGHWESWDPDGELKILMRF